jgi:hypothetical protein
MRVAPIAVAVAALALAGCGGSGPKTTKTTTKNATPVITNVRPTPGLKVVVVDVGPHGVTGGPVHAQIEKGRPAVLLVRSALADEVHVHGYDLKANVPAGGEIRLPFTASIAGRFVVELEHRGLQIAELDVQ